MDGLARLTAVEAAVDGARADRWAPARLALGVAALVGLGLGLGAVVPSARPPTATAAAGAVVAQQPPERPVATVFRAAEGDVVCTLLSSEGGMPDAARCVVLERAWEPAPDPSCRPVGAVLDGAASLVCGALGGVANAAPLLPDGGRASVGRVTCEVVGSGVACADAASGASFSVSPQGWSLG